MSTHNPRLRSPQEILKTLRELHAAGADQRDRLSMLHEIAVYQEELLAQNETLTLTQNALGQTRDRFIELYDFAPTAYLTLDEKGVIRQCNLTAAALIGRQKAALESLPFLDFVTAADRHVYLSFLHECRDTDKNAFQTQFAIRTADGRRHVQLLCRKRSAGASRELLVSLIDVTERLEIEREREQIARERAALAGRLITAQDEERRRIARDLHDDAGQQITALRLKLDELASAAHDEPTASALLRLQEMVEQLDERLHFVASELRPAALDLGIVSALEQFLHEWFSTFGVSVALHGARIAPGSIAPQVETHLYRIAQEALNNAAKYASASQVTVIVEQRDEGLVLAIEDDGRGFDIDSTRVGSECLGLVGMRERAQIMGARLDIETAPGRGTSIFVHVPNPSRG
jgi:PAS domain S-box-containing protein